MEAWHLLNASQALAFLCFAGFITCLWRFPKAEYPQHLIAFALMLAGTLIREVVIYLWGATTWGAAPTLASAIARDVQIVGALLFVRAVTQPRCGEWVWVGVAAAALLFATVII